MHIDSLVGIGAIGGGLGDLKEQSIKSNRVVFSDGTLLFETQSPLDLESTEFSPGRLCLSRLSESTVMDGKVAMEDHGCLLDGLGLGQAQLTDQPILESVPQSLDSPLALRAMGQDQRHSELF